jgi:DNA-binding transcriptional regulator GbsR (MarR family)
MLSMSPRRQISAGQVANKTGYSTSTVRYALKRLADWEMVDRDQPAPGTPYEYKLVEK